MTGDRGQEDRRGASGDRPGFLPPVHPPEPDPAAAPPSAPPGSPSFGWGAARLLTGMVLMVSAFLPWARAGVRLEGFGQVVERELVAEAGVNVDGTGQVVPVFAVVALVMIVWGLLARDPRIGALAAVPAVLALLSCLIFVLRLDRFGTRVEVGRILLGGVEVTAGYGWYLSVAASLLLIGLSLTRRGG